MKVNAKTSTCPLTMSQHDLQSITELNFSENPQNVQRDL